ASLLCDVFSSAKPLLCTMCFSSAGCGSSSHLAGEMLKLRTGINMVHVPNKGMNPALVDLIGGQVQAMFASVPAMLTEKSDRLRPIAMAGEKRSAPLPGLAAVEESRFPDFESAELGGVLWPARLAPPSRAQLPS